METEPEDMNTNAGMLPSRTIMVPLRDDSSPTEGRFQITRGRVSQPGTAKSKRSATPVRRNGRSRSRRQSVTDLDITVLGDDGESNDWSKRKSPRKKKPTPSRKLQPAQEQTDPVETLQSTSPKQKVQTSRSAKTIDIREDTDVEEDGAADAAVESDSPKLRSIDLNRVSVRSRSISSKQRPPNFASHGVEVSEESAEDVDTTTDEQPKHVSVINISYPTPDPSVQDDHEVYEPPPSLPDDRDANFDTILESEGFTMIDLESIPSARHLFSSPLEAQGTVQAPEPTVNLQNHDKTTGMRPTEQASPHSAQSMKSAPRAIPAYLTEGESDISSNVPSSPPVLSQPQRMMQPLSEKPHPRNITTQIYSSPKLPSPPRVMQPIPARDNAQLRKPTPPTLAKVVKAGIALQGVLSPKLNRAVPCSSGGTPKERLDSLFEGFDSSTRRELRAGLRFGEELAKRQRSSPDVEMPSTLNAQPERDVARTQFWRGEAFVQHTPIHAAIESKVANMAEANICKQNVRPKQLQPRKRSSLCQETKFTSSPPHTASTDSRSQFIIESQQHRELQWQRERQAVSTQIENARGSQVIVIDSDNDEQEAEDFDSHPPIEANKQDDRDDLDIWCEEAASCDQRSSNSRARPIQGSKEVKLSTVKQPVMLDQAQNAVNMPRRSVIPSPWRRGENVEDESSYLTNGDMTGLFLHDPKTKIKFGAAEIDRQKRQFSSGSFDIDRMAGTPHKPTANELQAPEDNIDGPETDDSDAWQLQTELSFNQNHVDETPGVSRELSCETFSEPSMAEDTEVEHVETVRDFMEAESSLSLPPQPIKIPVNFNDSTVSSIAPCLVQSSPSTAPESSRPSTPRSALKGARQSLGLENVNLPAVRRVVFSTREIRVDLDGQEEEATLDIVSSSPKIEIHQAVEELRPHSTEATEGSPAEKSGLFGWLWGGSKKIDSNSSPSTDGANDEKSGWKKPQASFTAGPARSQGAAVRTRTASYLLPPSYPSDPRRDTSIPMSTSGNFTDTHFRTLHIIYAKSLRPRFHAPRGAEVRPALRKLLGAAFEADESACGLGIFEWKVDEPALRVLERFMREVEWGYPAGKEVKWGWPEREICERLFRIVVGEEVRREEKAALEEVAG